MRAVTIADSRIVVTERPDPIPQTGELLVRVRAAGVNGADIIQMRGHYPAPPGVPRDIPGLELAGEVVAAGEGTARFRIGERVMALVAGGGQAELAAVPEVLAMPVPPGLSWEAAGGFPEVFVTAHDALVSQCALRPGERLLVHGAAGGVGTAAVQLGAAIGAEVTASVRRPELRAAVEALGARVIDPEETAGAGPFDVILELVGAPNLPANLRALAVRGRISVIGIGAGGRAELDLGLLMARRAVIAGSTLRSRTREEKAEAVRRVEAEVLPLLSGGRIRVVVAETHPLGAAADAYARFQAVGKLGKIVLTVP
jgi:NADPH2:quinone reductase